MRNAAPHRGVFAICLFFSLSSLGSRFYRLLQIK